MEHGSKNLQVENQNKISVFKTATITKPSLIRQQRRLEINLTNYNHKQKCIITINI